jgi:hypothetical protein
MADLSSTAKALCTASIAALLMFTTTVRCASAQSSGDIARGARSTGVSSPNTADIWDANLKRRGTIATHLSIR